MRVTLVKRLLEFVAMLVETIQLIKFTMLCICCFVFVFDMMRKRKLGDVPRAQEDGRLNWLRHSKYVSRRALANVIKSVQEEPVSNPSSTSQYRARKNLAATKTPYGPLVEEVKLENDVTLGISSPLAAMYWSCKHSPSYADIVFSAMQSRPPQR